MSLSAETAIFTCRSWYWLMATISRQKQVVIIDTNKKASLQKEELSSTHRRRQLFLLADGEAKYLIL
jgi:hypothetical protein